MRLAKTVRRPGRPSGSFRAPLVSTAVLIGAGLAACTTPARQVDARLPAAYEAPAGKPLPSQTLDQWWTTFDDPVLNDLVATALEKAPDARLAAARLAEARAVRQGQIRQLYVPQTPLTGSAKRTDTHIIDQSGSGGFTLGGVTKSLALDFDVSWELDLIGRRAAARRVVDNDLAAARFAYEGARAALAANVAQSYFEARGYAVQLEDARQSARIAQALYDVAAEKGRRGLTATSEAERSAADLAQTQAQVAQLEAQLQASRRSLLILVGKGVDPLASLPVEPVLAKAPPVPAAAPGELLARRPDVREAAARLASASGNLNVNELALFPTVTLAPGVGLSKQISPSFLKPGSTTSTTSSAWTLGANLSVPVLNIPKLMSDIKAQGARVEQAAVTYEQTVQKAFGEAEGALVQLDADERRVALLSAGERRAASAYEASRKGYAAGLTDLTTALQAEQSWRGARTALTGAQTQALQRAVQTYKALGGGWSPTSLPQQPSAQ
ncbi:MULTISPECIES: TolC family protein [Caulobacter]|jgi:multidrug efflux system outer membrane protein|uniref:Efflux transporter, outer membrane factor lipoprotein, NodT family n=1 Tax=Caulobacter vibrioides OR37 TaxID=1292034 RepID=R0E9N6_CAUVI|nr:MULTISPECIES: TolC family protein [Caulobacter]ENZ78097.1 efflux transporter, outer membrane factor lipoprotein, NodT family [Caulobacter vibrioides OR37]MBQ1561174.1 TolC family protein [Caulobacter sp.]